MLAMMSIESNGDCNAVNSGKSGKGCRAVDSGENKDECSVGLFQINSKYHHVMTIKQEPLIT